MRKNHQTMAYLFFFTALLISCNDHPAARTPKIIKEGNRVEVNEEKAISKIGVKPSKYADIYKKAAKFITAKNYDSAVACYEKLITMEDSTNKAYAYWGLGTTYTLQGNYDKAIESLNESIRIDGRSNYGYIALGSVYYYQQQFEKAIFYYEKAKAINANTPDSYYGLALTYYELGNSDKAKMNAKKFLALVPETTFRPALEKILNY